MTFIKLYFISLATFFLTDLLWLGVIAKNLYKSEIGHLMSSQFKVIPAIIFYLIYIAGLVFFAVLPNISSQSIKAAILYGALFGFVAYATYDFTNYATLKDWPLKIVVIDLLWGAFISGLTAGTCFSLGLYWKII